MANSETIAYRLANGKVVQIPKSELRQLMATLKISQSEAADVWLCDNDYTTNAEQEALDQKAKENRITATIHQAKAEKSVTQKTQRERVKKADPTKTQIITDIAELLQTRAKDVQIVNDTKLITFTIGDEQYKLDLTRTNLKLKEKKAGGGN